MSEGRAQLFLLGSCGLRTSTGEHLELRRDRGTALLALLALRAGREISRSDLAEALWPDALCESAQASLSTALWALRKQLSTLQIDSRHVLRTSGATVWVDANSLTVDCHDFERHLTHVRLATDPVSKVAHYQAALSLYHGDLLPGFTEEWVYPERTRYRAHYLQALADLSDLYAAAGEMDEAFPPAARALEAEPLDIGACARLLRLYTQAGRPATAVRLYEDFVRLFRERMDMDPGDSLHALAQEARLAMTQVTSPGPRQPQPQRQDDTCVSDAFSGGALSPDAPFYVRRPADDAIEAAIQSGESVVLVHGPRQTGKSSLLARGLAFARRERRHTAFLDFQTFGEREMSSSDAFFFALARALADQLDLSENPRATWEADRGAARNLRLYLRRSVLPALDGPLVWALDEVDRLFTCPFGNEVFGLFRSWHNERALDPQGPWRRLTLALAYATEAHLFISDLNQSPFNVGVRLEVTDFTREQARELARSLGITVTESDLEALSRLLGGHPFLLHRAVHALAREGATVAAIESTAASGDGLFRRHLTRLDHALKQDPHLKGALQDFAAGRGLSEDHFLRLRAAGVLRGNDPQSARFRCGLYEAFLTGVKP